MRKFLFLLFVSLFLLGAASCANGDPGTAVAYLNALNERDLETALDLVCEARQDDVTMGLVSVQGPPVEAYEFTNISCASRAGNVLCRFTIEQKLPRDDVEGIAGIAVPQSREVLFEMEDGQICGFEEQVAQ